MEKTIETTIIIVGYAGIPVSIHSFIPSEPKASHLSVHGSPWVLGRHQKVRYQCTSLIEAPSLGHCGFWRVLGLGAWDTGLGM